MKSMSGFIKKLFVLIGVSFIITGAFGQTTGTLSVEVETHGTGGKYAPKNIVAIWVENSNGDFVKTLLAYCDKRKTNLNNWQKSTGNAGVEYNTVDAITGSTQKNHDVRSCSWNATTYNADTVEDGMYKLCMELTDKNSTGNYSSIEIEKLPDAYDLFPEDETSFSSIKISWQNENVTAIVNEEVTQLKVYPTVTSGILYVEGSDIKNVLVYDQKGDLLFSTNKLQIDMTSFSNAVYLVKVKTENTVLMQRVVKM